MDDRLVWLLRRYELRAQVFQAGPLTSAAEPELHSDIGYLHLLESGTVRVVNDGTEEQLVTGPGAFFYMNPLQHLVEPLSEDVSMVCASFEFGIGQGNPLQAALPEMMMLDLDECPGLGTTLKQLFREASEKHCGRDAILDRLSEIVLIQILRLLMDEQRLDIGLLAGLSDPRLAIAINAVHEHPEKDWTLAGMANVAAMSRARFAARFREVVGTTPGAYLADWRLGLAQSMLLRGHSIQAIAVEVGYGSASALSRVFSNRFGMSPSAWRRKKMAA